MEEVAIAHLRARNNQSKKSDLGVDFDPSSVPIMIFYCEMKFDCDREVMGNLFIPFFLSFSVSLLLNCNFFLGVATHD